MLRRLHPRPDFKVHWSRLSVNSIYDDVVAEFSCPELWGAYNLLYPRDQRRITTEALRAAGLAGLTAAWLDDGERAPESARLRLNGVGPPATEVLPWLESIGAAGRIVTGPRRCVNLGWDQSQTHLMIQAIRPLVHRCMAHRLRPRGPGARSFYAGL